MATNSIRGLEQIARLVSGATTAGLYWEYMSLGCGGIAESSAHTTLHQEMTTNGGQRGAATNYYSGSGGYFGKWQRTFPITGSTSIAEAGLFTTMALTASSMLLRHKFGSAYSVVSGDSFTLTLVDQFS